MKLANSLFFVLILILIWDRMPSSVLPRIRYEEAAKIVELYENRFSDACLDLERNEESLAYAEEKYRRLSTLDGAGIIPLNKLRDAEREILIAKMNIRGSKIDLREIEIELELAKIRLRAAAISPDDFTIYVDQRTKR